MLNSMAINDILHLLQTGAAADVARWEREYQQLAEQNENEVDPMLLARVIDNNREMLEIAVCRICYENRIDCVLIGRDRVCNHAICKSCVEKLIGDPRLCPVCRAEIQQVLAVRDDNLG